MSFSWSSLLMQSKRKAKSRAELGSEVTLAPDDGLGFSRAWGFRDFHKQPARFIATLSGLPS